MKMIYLLETKWNQSEDRWSAARACTPSSHASSSLLAHRHAPPQGKLSATIEKLYSPQEAGVDDYIRKPFSAPHLLARIAAVLRRMPKSVGKKEKVVVQLEDCEIDLGTRRVSSNGPPQRRKLAFAGS